MINNVTQIFDTPDDSKIDSIHFIDRFNINPLSIVESEIIQISGVNVPVELKLNGDFSARVRVCYDKRCNLVLEDWTSQEVLVKNHNFIQLKLTAPSGNNVSTEVNILVNGSVEDSWAIRSSVVNNQAESQIFSAGTDFTAPKAAFGIRMAKINKNTVAIHSRQPNDRANIFNLDTLTRVSTIENAYLYDAFDDESLFIDDSSDGVFKLVNIYTGNMIKSFGDANTPVGGMNTVYLEETNQLLVGAAEDLNPSGIKTGSVLIFDFDSGALQAKIFPDPADAEEGMKFGQSVFKLDCNRLIITAPKAQSLSNPLAPDAGSFFVYALDDLNKILRVDNPNPSGPNYTATTFGWSYGFEIVDSDRVLVGSSEIYTNNKRAGSVYLMNVNDGSLIRKYGKGLDPMNVSLGLGVALLDENTFVTGRVNDIYVYDINSENPVYQIDNDGRGILEPIIPLSKNRFLIGRWQNNNSTDGGRVELLDIPNF